MRLYSKAFYFRVERRHIYPYKPCRMHLMSRCFFERASYQMNLEPAQLVAQINSLTDGIASNRFTSLSKTKTLRLSIVIFVLRSFCLRVFMVNDCFIKRMFSIKTVSTILSPDGCFNSRSVMIRQMPRRSKTIINRLDFLFLQFV